LTRPRLPYNTFYNGFQISSALPYGLKPQKVAGRLHDRGTDKFPSLPMGLQQGQDLIDTIEHDETIQSSRASARSIHTNSSSHVDIDAGIQVLSQNEFGMK
jgi:hypothetical protein